MIASGLSRQPGGGWRSHQQFISVFYATVISVRFILFLDRNLHQESAPRVEKSSDAYESLSWMKDYPWSKYKCTIKCPSNVIKMTVERSRNRQAAFTCTRQKKSDKSEKNVGPEAFFWFLSNVGCLLSFACESNRSNQSFDQTRGQCKADLHLQNDFEF